MDKLIANYKAFETLDRELLDELGVCFSGVREGLRQKISGLKNLYWNELFDNLSKVTDRLTKSSREALLGKLTSHTDVDFNAANAYAVLAWVIKSSNNYFDRQLVETMERMVEQANIINYKSNEKTFGKEHWRYCSRPEGLTRFALETRVVLERVGGLCVSEFKFDQNKYNGLTGGAHWFLMDILTIAANLGFDTLGCERPGDFTWESNSAVTFHYNDHVSGTSQPLVSVRVFKNGNMHCKFNQAFMQSLNLEFGRLKGWLKSAAEAADELDMSLEEVQARFKSNLQLNPATVLRLGFAEE